MVSDTTEKQYKYLLSKFPISCLEDSGSVFHNLMSIRTGGNKKLSKSTIKTILSAIIWKLTNDKCDESVIDAYRSYNKYLKTFTDKEEDDDKKIHGVIPKWKDVERARDATKNDTARLLLSLYTMIPPRRVQDYEKMYVSYTNRNDKEHNYYCIESKCFIFNRFKTSKHYGQQIIRVPDALITVLNDYIDNHDIGNNKPLFEISRRTMHNILKRAIGCGVNNIRHAFVNRELEKTHDIRKNAEMMGHSLSTHFKYRKNYRDNETDDYVFL